MKSLRELKIEIEQQSKFDYESAFYWETKMNEVTEALLAVRADVSNFHELLQTREYLQSVYKGYRHDAPGYLRGVQKDLLKIIKKNMD